MALMTITTSVSEFQNIRDGNKYYVDKSLLIDDLLSTDDSGSYLYIRPRRFGKSMNLSMLDAFFNMRYRGNRWFDGLAISGHDEYRGYMNAFPVIRLDFKDLNVTTWEDFLRSLEGVIIDAYLSYDDILDGDLPSYYRDHHQRILAGNNDSGTLERSLSTLATMMRRRYGRKVLVLIDEYDNPMTSSLGTETNPRITGLMKSIYSKLLKGNMDVQMSYVTGTSRIIHQGFFSGLNNMYVDDAFSTMSEERFGFTESETRTILEYYGSRDRIDEVREWYDGYRFGNADVYNPFSLMSYIRNGCRPSPYWVGTSRNSILRWMLERVDARRILDMSRILSGETVELNLPRHTSLSEMTVPEDWHIFYALVEMGYLKVIARGDGRYVLSIPNKEVSVGIEYELTHIVGLGNEAVNSLVNAMLSMDDVVMMDSLDIILNDQSFFTLKDERYYAAVLVTAIRPLNGRYNVLSEFENGDGRVDIFLLPRDGPSEPIVIEIKCVDREDGMEHAMEHAFDQISKRRYYQGIRGDAVLMGVVFCGKRSMVRSCRVRVGRCDLVTSDDGHTSMD